jgi:hypothetical protein
LAPKGKKGTLPPLVPASKRKKGNISSSCPWQQKEKKNTARSLCNFLLLSLAPKGKFETGQGRAGQGKAVKNKE